MYDRESQEYREALGEAIYQRVFGQRREEAPAQEESPQGHGSADGGAHGPAPQRTKTHADAILDTVYGFSHFNGEIWTDGRGGA
jgi:hypothetical protein